MTDGTFPVATTTTFRPDKVIDDESVQNLMQPRSNLQARFMTNPRYQRLMQQLDPISVTGQSLITQDRRVLWKNVCLIGDEVRECIVEMSKTKHKFYIVALDLEYGKF
jgi:hypothetical protein